MVKEVCNQQLFYDDLIANKRPQLVIQTLCQQHGKSDLIVSFISWLAGKSKPDLIEQYTSFSDRLGVRKSKIANVCMIVKFINYVFPDKKKLESLVWC